MDDTVLVRLSYLLLTPENRTTVASASSKQMYRYVVYDSDAVTVCGNSSKTIS